MVIGSLEISIANVDALRPEVGEHRPPAASADVEPASEAAVTMTPVTAMTMAMTEAVSATVHAVSTAMPTTVTTTSRSRGDSGSGQSERGDGGERDLAKHICSLHLRGVIA